MALSRFNVSTNPLLLFRRFKNDDRVLTDTPTQGITIPQKDNNAIRRRMHDHTIRGNTWLTTYARERSFFLFSFLPSIYYVLLAFLNFNCCRIIDFLNVDSDIICTDPSDRPNNKRLYQQTDIERHKRANIKRLWIDYINRQDKHLVKEIKAR